MDDLRARISFQRDIRDCNILCLTETWLTPMVPVTALTPSDNFSVLRMDRTAEARKTEGGGVCFMINKKWCGSRNISILSCSCSPHIEHLSIICRPFYLPREFSSIIVTAVYIPPQADTSLALSKLHKMPTKCLQSPLTVGFWEIGPCRHFPHTGIQITDRPGPPVEREVTRWSSHSEVTLQAALDDVDWDMFQASSSDVSEFTEVALSFVNTLTEQATETVTIRTFSNQKPWVDRIIRDAINHRTAAYRAGILSGNMSEYKASSYTLRRAVRAAKRRYRERI